MAEIVTIGDATLYLGDCMEILPTLGSVDAVITDPPYGNDDTHAGHLAKVILKNGEAAGQALGFDGISKKQMIDMARDWVKKANRWVVFTSEWKFMTELDEAGLLIRFGIWRKPDGAPQFTGDRPGTGWEAIAICHRSGKKRWNGGGKHAFYNWAKGSNNSGHPTGKPIGLFSEFVRDFTDLGETVLDPFMGSGTTGVAAIQMGRKFIGIEREPKYFEIACKRIEQASKQVDMFIEQPKHEQVALL
jgi:site-specific DNA-methyltransferase (adenine-specific)